MAERGNAIEALPKGKIVLNAPSAMTVGQKREVQANVGIDVPVETLKKHLGAQDQQIVGALSVSSEMIAALSGPDFTIESITPEQQSIARGFPTVWSWNVTANEDGEQELEATLYALVSNTRQRVDSYSQKIRRKCSSANVD